MQDCPLSPVSSNVSLLLYHSHWYTNSLLLKNNKNKTYTTYNPLKKLHFLALFCSKKNPQRSCLSILWSMSLSTHFLYFSFVLVSTHFLSSLFFMHSWIQLDFHPHSNCNSSYRDYQSTNSLLPNRVHSCDLW